MRLYDRPDPRRLDLRASLRNIQQQWLVRVNRQRSSIPVHAVVDVSASMIFGSRRSKLDVAADFIEALGQSTFRVGDSLGMVAFDERERTDLLVPARVGRGVGDTMAKLLRTHPRGTLSHGSSQRGLRDAIQHLAGRRGLVFLISDFHWPLDDMPASLDLLSHSFVVPMVVWDPAEIEAPAHNGLAQLHDMESGAQRTVWIRRRMRQEWRDSVDARRRKLDGLFAESAMRPFYMIGHFDSDALSEYFFEVAA